MSSMFYMLTVDDVVTVDVINIVVVVDAIIEVDVDAVDINKVINVHDIVDIVNGNITYSGPLELTQYFIKKTFFFKTNRKSS